MKRNSTPTSSTGISAILLSHLLCGYCRAHIIMQDTNVQIFNPQFSLASIPQVMPAAKNTSKGNISSPRGYVTTVIITKTIAVKAFLVFFFVIGIIKINTKTTIDKIINELPQIYSKKCFFFIMKKTICTITRLMLNR